MLLDYGGFANAHPDVPMLLSWMPNFPGCSKNPGQYSIRYLYPSPMRETEFLRMSRNGRMKFQYANRVCSSVGLSGCSTYAVFTGVMARSLSHP